MVIKWHPKPTALPSSLVPGTIGRFLAAVKCVPVESFVLLDVDCDGEAVGLGAAMVRLAINVMHFIDENNGLLGTDEVRLRGAQPGG